MTEAFDQLKKEMQADIELAYHNFDDISNKLELYVDVSDTGAGAYFAQKQEGRHHWICINDFHKNWT